MQFLFDGISEAFLLLVSGDREFLRIVATSVELALVSTMLAGIGGVPLGLFLAVSSFRGKAVIERMLETLLALPTVLIGLLGYAFLSRQGPLGGFSLLYTKSAVIIGQTALIVPLIATMTHSSLRMVGARYRRAMAALGADDLQVMTGLLREGKEALAAALLAGFGRVFSEVGIAMMLGGNIAGETRTITTAIALETARGEFALGIALGIVLLLVSLLLALSASFLRRRA